jgi:hypothetical protein
VHSVAVADLLLTCLRQFDRVFVRDTANKFSLLAIEAGPPRSFFLARRLLYAAVVLMRSTIRPSSSGSARAVSVSLGAVSAAPARSFPQPRADPLNLRGEEGAGGL